MSNAARPSDDCYLKRSGLPEPHSRYVNAVPSTANSTVENGEPAARRPSCTPLELDACCRSNIVTARTRFYEEKTRSVLPATTTQRRSRSATPRSTRDDHDQHPRSNPDSIGAPVSQPIARQLPTARSTQTVSSTPVQNYQNRHGPLMPALKAASESNLPANHTGVNNETDELKVLTHLQLIIVELCTFCILITRFMQQSRSRFFTNFILDVKSCGSKGNGSCLTACKINRRCRKEDISPANHFLHRPFPFLPD